MAAPTMSPTSARSTGDVTMSRLPRKPRAQRRPMRLPPGIGGLNVLQLDLFRVPRRARGKRDLMARLREGRGAMTMDDVPEIPEPTPKTVYDELPLKIITC